MRVPRLYADPVQQIDALWVAYYRLVVLDCSYNAPTSIGPPRPKVCAWCSDDLDVFPVLLLLRHVVR